MKNLFLLLVFVFEFQLGFAQLKSKITVLNGEIKSELLKDRLLRNANLFLESISYNQKLPRSIVSQNGAQRIDTFLNNRPFVALKSKYELLLTEDVNQGQYILNGLTVRYLNEERQPGIIPEVSLYFDAEARLMNIVPSETQFTMDADSYNEIEDQNLAVKEFIHHFLKEYKTAFKKKDIQFIKDIFIDKALIIVGREIKPETSRDMEGILKSSTKYQYLRLTKNEYTDRLEKQVFKNNDEININFSEMEVFQHPVYKDLYRISLKQDYRSSTYNDLGYLTLILGVVNAKPVVYVRVWQSTDDFNNPLTKITTDDFDING